MHHEARRLAGALLWVALATGCDGEPEAVPQETAKAAVTVAKEAEPPTEPANVEPDAGGPVAVVEVKAATIATEGHPTLVETLSAARCQRELRCGKVGADKEHPSLIACRASVATSWRSELNRYRCAGEIERDGLRACLQDIQKVDCAKPFETLKTIATCKLGALCLAQR